MVVSDYKEYGWSDAAPLPYHKHLIRHIERLLPKDGTPILDIGCGNGALTNELITKGYCVYGIDASNNGIAIANKRNPGRFFVNDVVAGTLPEELKEIPFKTVISIEVIEHLYNPRSYISFVKDILKKGEGGTLIISTPYHGYLKNLLIALSGRMDYHFSVLWDGGHIKFWSRKTLYSLLNQAGFEKMRFIGSGHTFLLWKQMIIKSEINKF